MSFIRRYIIIYSIQLLQTLVNYRRVKIIFIYKISTVYELIKILLVSIHRFNDR